MYKIALHIHMADVPRIQIKSVKNYYWVRTKLLPLSSTEVFNSLPYQCNITDNFAIPHQHPHRRHRHHPRRPGQPPQRRRSNWPGSRRYPWEPSEVAF